MKYLSTVVLGIAAGISCAWLQYWMASRLDKKRWLLLLQPGLLAAIALCFAVWVFSLDELYNPAVRLTPLLFVAMIICAAAGWAVGNFRRKRKDP